MFPTGSIYASALADAFTITEQGPITPETVDALTELMRAQGALGLVDDRGLALAQPRPDVRAAAFAGAARGRRGDRRGRRRNAHRAPIAERRVAVPP